MSIVTHSKNGLAYNVHSIRAVSNQADSWKSRGYPWIPKHGTFSGTAGPRRSGKSGLLSWVRGPSYTCPPPDSQTYIKGTLGNLIRKQKGEWSGGCFLTTSFTKMANGEYRSFHVLSCVTYICLRERGLRLINLYHQSLTLWLKQSVDPDVLSRTIS